MEYNINDAVKVVQRFNGVDKIYDAEVRKIEATFMWVRVFLSERRKGVRPWKFRQVLDGSFKYHTWTLLHQNKSSSTPVAG